MGRFGRSMPLLRRSMHLLPHSGPSPATTKTFVSVIDPSQPPGDPMPASRTTIQANDQEVLEGIATRIPASMLLLGRKVYTQSSLTTVI
jgi:hypothetical protein